MHAYYVTFTYEHITHPDTGAELVERPAYDQWVAEFNCAVCEWTDLVAFKVTEVHSDECRAVVRLVLPEAATTERLAEDVQEHLYDRGGLSGHFQVGVARHYIVEVTLTREIAVLATSEQAAREEASRRFPKAIATNIVG